MSEPKLTTKRPRTHQSPDEPSNNPPPEVFGADRNSVSEQGGPPTPIGNTLMKEPDAEYTPPEKVRNIYNPEETDTLPRYRGVIKPVYPQAARMRGIQGTVKISVVIDERGYPIQLKVAQGIGYGCDEAALQAVGKHRFFPGTIKGRPIKVEVIVPVQFKISWRE